MWGCGLEQYPDLLSSPEKLEPVPGYFRFRKTAGNGDPIREPDFRGFELYYKVYQFGDDSAVNADVAAIGSQDDLAGRQFRRLNAAEDRPVDRVGNLAKPLVGIAPTDRAKEILITVDFSGDLSPSTPYPRITDSGTPALVAPVDEQDTRRAINYTDVGLQDRFKTFAEFEQTDGDITPAIWDDINFNQPVTLVLYVVSYGRDVSSNRELFSRPVWLGAINLTNFKPKS